MQRLQGHGRDRRASLIMMHAPWKGIDALIPVLASSVLPRSPGLHVSELYSQLHPQKARKNPITEDELAVYAIGGFSMEMVLEAGFQQLVAARCTDMGLDVERPGEIVSSEGVICSPDLFFHEPDDIVIGDIKCKWLSTKGMPVSEEGEDNFPGTKFDKHFSQLQAYLHVLSENLGRPFTRGRLIVYFVNGNWQDFKPKLHAWDLEWSVQEIEETWDALMTIWRG